MKLGRITVRLADKNDYSGKPKEEVEAAIVDMKKECINQIVRGIIERNLLKFRLTTTENGGFEAVAVIGVYNIDEADGVMEQPEMKKEMPN